MTQFTEVNDANYLKAGQTSCGYPVTYSAQWKNFYGTVIDLPSFIIWNPTNFRFEVQSSNGIDLTNARQTYEIHLTASVPSTDMSPPFSKTQVVKLNAKNDCLADEMTVLSGITDYTYYINENTEKDVWTFGTTPKPKVMTWNPTWSQSVAGCPIEAKLYRTVSGVRTLLLAGSYERGPITSLAYTSIPTNVFWSVT